MTDKSSISGDEQDKTPKYSITRASLVDGSYIARSRQIIASIAPDYKIPTDAELADAQTKFLDGYESGRALWVFGYGSLMWNPAIEFVERRTGVARGWSRRFNLWITAARGTIERPGLMLGLQKGGEVEGVLLRLDPDPRLAQQELSYVWQREALAGIYVPQWVDVATDKDTVKAITFVSNINHIYYAGDLPDEDVAGVVATASGTSGSCLEYLDETMSSLARLGIHDEHLHNISRLIADK